MVDGKFGWEHPVRRLNMLRFPYEHKTDFYTRIGVSRGFMSRLASSSGTGVSLKAWQEIFDKARVKNPVLIHWILFGTEPTKNITRLLRKYHGQQTENEELNYELFMTRLNHFRLEGESKNNFMIRLGVPAHIWEQWGIAHMKEVNPSEVVRICKILGVDYRSPEGVWLMFSTKDGPPEKH